MPGSGLELGKEQLNRRFSKRLPRVCAPARLQLQVESLPGSHGSRESPGPLFLPKPVVLKMLKQG